MPLIHDPDFLIDTVEIIIDVSTKTVELVVTDPSGYLSTDGVTIKAVYSKLKELWKSNENYIKFPFPMSPITDEQFEMINGWDWEGDSTRYLLRNGGWAVIDDLGSATQMWSSIISLGVIGESDQAYFIQKDLASPSDESPVTNFQLTGPVNQAVMIYNSGTGVDYRNSFEMYCRIYGKTYAFSQLSEIGVSSMTYQAYRFPLANTTDVKINNNDNTVSTSEPYIGMSITWYDTPQSKIVGESNYDFSIIINGNNATAEQIYEFVQYKLRQTGDIDYGSGYQIGLMSGSLLRFVGDTLYTNKISEGGVFIDNYQDSDINRLVFTDDIGVERVFPFTAVLTVNFGDNLMNDNDAKFWVYFSADYGTTSAILVDDADGDPMTGVISSEVIGENTFVQLSYAYESNIQRGGGTNNTPAPITAVAIGLETGQFVRATGTIERSVANSTSLISALERNYANPE